MLMRLTITLPAAPAGGPTLLRRVAGGARVRQGRVQGPPALARLWRREAVLSVRQAGQVDGRVESCYFFRGDTFLLAEVGFSGCPQDREPLSSSQPVALQLPGLTPS